MDWKKHDHVARITSLQVGQLIRSCKKSCVELRIKIANLSEISCAEHIFGDSRYLGRQEIRGWRQKI